MRLLTLLACSQPQVAPVETAPVTAVDTGDGWEPPAPTWEAAEVQARLQAAIDAGLPDPVSLLEWFQWAVDQGDEAGCPFVPRPFTLSESFAGCVSSSGWRFAGLTLYEMVEDGFELTGDASLTDPDGLPFPCSGYIRAYKYGEDRLLRFGGWWGYAKADGWVAHVPDLTLDIEVTPDTVRLLGGFGPDGEAVYFDDTTVDATGHGGGVRLRDPTGGWYAVALGADGCGAVDWYGTTLGDVCVDLRPAVEDLRLRLEEP